MSVTKHITTLLFLVPFLVMLIFQTLLNYDDNLMTLPRPGKRDGQNYNLIMVLVFWLGTIAYLIHMVVYAHVSQRWLVTKIAFLAAFFLGLFCL